jgi:two-component system, cell cycle response regulator
VTQAIAAAATLGVVFLVVAAVFWRLRGRLPLAVRLPAGPSPPPGALDMSAVTLRRVTPAHAPVEPLPAAPAPTTAADPRGPAPATAPPAAPTPATSTRRGFALADRLAPAATLVEATGVALWAVSPDGSQLDIVASHGYPDDFVTRISPLPVDAHVLTAVAFAERRVRQRARRGDQPAAIAIPVEIHDHPVGVLTAEMDPSVSSEVPPDADALLRLLATQMAASVAALAPFPTGRGAAVRTDGVRAPAPRPRTQLLPAYDIPVSQTALEPPSVAAASVHVPPSDPDLTDMDSIVADAPSARDARSRFIAGFRKRCTTIDELIAEVEQKGADGPLVALKQIVRRLSGLAGIVAMPTVADRAMALDRLLESPNAAQHVARVREAFTAMCEAYQSDLEVVPPTWAAPSGPAVGAHVLLVTDEAELAPRMSDDLRSAAYRVTLTGSGPRALALARSERPDVVLLDVSLRGEMDGHAVCRALKGDPELADIPVVLMASHTSTVDRMAGFALGADDYLAKPVQTIEMLLRVRWMLTRPTADRQPPPAGGGVMPSDAFVAAARDVLRQGSAALGVVRVSSAAMADVAALFGDDLRRKDLLGRYSETQLVVLMPGATAGVAARRIGGVLDIARAAGVETACAGVTATGLAAERYVEPMLAQAEAALSSAQVQGEPVSVYGTGSSTRRGMVLVVDNDPDVVHIVDARLKAAGLDTIVAFDGAEALHRVETLAPAVMVLELTLPKRSGFDVLARLREMPEPRPKVIVVSSRSREEDVMRAFDLGADDYLTKPFSPQELLARIARLLR